MSVVAVMRSRRERQQRLMDELLKDSESYSGRIGEDLARLWSGYLAEHRVAVFAALAVTLLSSTHGFIIALANRYLVDEVILLGTMVRPTLEQQLPKFSVWAVALLGAWGMLTATQWVRSRLIVGVAQSLVFKLRSELHQKLQTLHVGFFEHNETGRLMSRVLEDVWVIREWSTAQSINIAANVFQLAVGLGTAFVVNWRLTLMTMVSMPLYFWAFARLRPVIRRLSIAMRRVNAGMYGRSQERIGAVAVVKAFDQERREVLDFRMRMNTFVRLSMQVVTYQGVMTALAGIITAVTTGIVVYIGFSWARSGLLTIGEVVFFVNILPRLYGPVSALAGFLVQVQAALVVLKRVLNLLDEPVDVRPGGAPLDSVTGEVVFDNVTFTYPGQARPALRDVSFAIRPGQKIALMGPSGAGKSTLFSLLLRFYDPQRGRVLLDGVGLSDADPAAVRRHVVMVQQEPVIFSGTVAENIVYGRENAGARDIMDAARQAELHDFIMTLPVKYETEVGRNGVSLSGGQRQRLALATALLTRPEVLLLDDTTSALDAATESRIRQTLNRVLEGRTSIIITQRIATARGCDRIIVLEDGRLSQSGTHEELSRQVGFYQKILIQQESL